MTHRTAFSLAGTFAVALFSSLPPLKALTVSPANQTVRAMYGGVSLNPTPISIQATGAWKAVTSLPETVALQPNAGSGRATVNVVAVGWWLGRLAPGKHEVTLTITEGNQQTTAKVTYEVVANPTPRFESVSEPKGCVDVPNLSPANKAVCTVPDLRPPGNFMPPARGKSYQDPTFGTTIHVVSDFPSTHGYSSPAPISANGRYALINSTGQPGLITLPEGKPFGKSVPVPIEGTLFDAVDDNLLYAISDGAIKSYHSGTRKWKTIVDYTRKPFSFASISFGGTGELSKDNWISFFAPQERKVCALDTSTAQTYCGALGGADKIDFTTMAKGVDRKTGLRYVIVIGPRPFQVFAVNLQTKSLDLALIGPENMIMQNSGNRDGVCDPGENCINGGHSDSYEDAEGNQYLAVALESQLPCEYSLYTIRLNAGPKMGIPAPLGGGLTRIMPLFRCSTSDQWVDYHLGCAKRSPYCVVSTTSSRYNQARQPGDLSAPKQSPYLGEVFLFGNNGAVVRRLFYHRSVAFANEEASGYWSTARAAIAPDGSLVIADSNFGFPNQHRVVVAETGIPAR
ncbi:MAG: hypothetical protein U0R19_38045 [Bryobacteraceae bacterium]